MSVEWRPCWMPSSTRTVIARAARIMSTARSTSARSTSACAIQSSTGTRPSTAATSANPSVRAARNSSSCAAALDHHGQDGGEQVGVGARPQRQVQVRDLRRLRPARVDHDHLARRVVLDLVERVAGVGEPVREPRVAAQHDEQVALLDAFCRVARLGAEHLAVDPEVARLLLRERVDEPRRVHPPQQGRAVGATGVVALPAPARVEHRAGPAGRGVGVADRGELRRDLGQRRLPTDRLVPAAGEAPQRRGEPVVVVAVPGQALCLLAQVARGARVLLVAADPGDRPAVELHLQPAVEVAEAAGGLVPLGAHEMSFTRSSALARVVSLASSVSPAG